MRPRLHIKLLGAPAVFWDDVSLPLPTRRSLQLLCIVALSDRAMSRARLGRVLWTVPRAVNLRQELAKLRKLPEASHWLRERCGHVDLDAVTDVDEFLAATRRGDHALAIRIWRRDRESYKRRDHLLFGLSPPDPSPSFLELLDEERGHLNAVYARALQCRAIELEQEGDVETALRLNRELIGLDELNESAHQSIMQLEWRRGNLAGALRQFEECRQALAAVADMPPLYETQQIAVRVRKAMAAQASRRHVVPVPATLFVGRERELRTIDEILSRRDCRILSLLGPSGVGKTRLALEAARRRAPAFADGVGYVRLEAVRNAAHVPFALAHAIDMKAPQWDEGAQRVAEHFRTRSMLLVVDDLERVPAAAEYLASLSRLSPRSKLLVTSGRRMYLPDEHVYQVRGMSCTAAHMEPRGEHCDAIRLFLQAARRIQPSFELTEATKPHLVRIVKLVGGMPLAIEAVASWVRVLPPQVLADELEANDNLLRAREPVGNERHACMRTVLEHSMRRLPPRQAQVLGHLAALEGSFDLDAAAKEAGAELVDLWLLLDLCFLTWDGARFTMLDLVRRMVLVPQARHADGFHSS